ncbi:MAG: peptidylprolyl isomerase [Ruminiclostridium sp.]|nr:peptidylprolyl isomerase [Ruminiclostridium sp.]
MNFKRKLAAVLAGIMTVTAFSGCSMLGGQNTNALGSYNFSEMNLVQLDKPAEGQDVAIIETNVGTITAVLYAEFAPNTVANFKKRAEEGFYDGKPFFALQKGIYAITGASNDEGTEGITDDGKYIENECSVNLWPFKGSLLGYSSQQGYSDSRFFFTGALEVTEENKKELRGYTNQETSAQVIPEELITAFEKRGSVPGFAGSYTVFGQVINGFDVLDKILWTDSDKSNMKPLEELKIVKVTLDTYKDGKFTIEEPTSDKYLSAEEIEKMQNESGGATSSVAESTSAN